MRESGGDNGSSGRSSLNFDMVLCGVDEPALRKVLSVTMGGGCWRLAKDSRDVFENSEGVLRPWKDVLSFRLVPRLKKLVQVLTRWLL